MKNGVDLGKLTLLRILGVTLTDVESLVSPETSVGKQNIRRVYEAEGGDVLVQLRNTDPENPEETMNRLAKKFGADKIVKVCSTMPARF